MKEIIENSESDDEVYFVEEILDHQTTEKGTKYYIKWEGYDTSFNTWEFEENLDCPDILEKYLIKINERNQLHPKKKHKHPGRPSRSNSLKPPEIQYEEIEKIPVVMGYPSERELEDWDNWEDEAEMVMSVKKYSEKAIYAIVAWKNGIYSAVKIEEAHKNLQNLMLNFYYSNLKFKHKSSLC
ncbi:hypothetical protein CONCODRAFT_77063 [Conidiobolus coronatus NRRL 28638]|uniref:Chromo domain-containing protein n=1 Tax=Conidiobolus coronatus (strain ATCC 28846 / CBS 209.66 / NRRL 28638) TaxID=796925 RepID=A0A137PGG8_CONC2|nr:hypothetical protein CONCODRAFT_77063 [Conidiobolus coronatus NRRL 28638]|eukprot:KXN74070.1 hypothetical protein CONCODRAFT_77063 [Conidiobolus coronatus NRRL 28638]